ncbi:MAG: IS982 family transposase [Candidatus Omnitrophota bacterium]|nr:MAG: IS982 family transposase [Candidatus Omnitrophota bacterium]
MLAPIIEIFCDLDDFCKDFFQGQAAKVLPNPNRKRRRECRMSISEIMTIIVLFHLSHYRTFKDFYHECVLFHLRNYFPQLVSYNRFVELQASVIAPLTAYLLSKRGKETDLYYVDSSPIKVCHNRRIYKHKVFKGIAERGKHSMGWFFGFKLHLAINHKGELMNFCFTIGNKSDLSVLRFLLKNLKGLAAGDKGYISKQKTEELTKQGLQFITKIRKNMKQKMMSSFAKFFLSKRGVVETVIEQLKSICQIEHTRHRSPFNFITNLLAALAAYVLKPRKPSLKFNNLPTKLAFLTSN